MEKSTNAFATANSSQKVPYLHVPFDTYDEGRVPWDYGCLSSQYHLQGKATRPEQCICVARVGDTTTSVVNVNNVKSK